MSCVQTITDYGLRAIGIGERLLPKADITLCEQIVLIGSGMMWNIYFGVLALAIGFWLAVAVALGKNAQNAWLRLPATGFIFLLRGSPLFIQFFIAYLLFVSLPKMGINLNFGFVEINMETRWLTRAWMGAVIVLFLNTAAYTGEIFYGAVRSVPIGDIEAAKAFGMNGRQIFWRVEWPTMLRLAWPSYTNEAIFLFHATTLVFFSGFPAWRQSGDALYYASYFADKTFNPFVAYPIVAVYFIVLTLVIVGVMGRVERYLNRHQTHFVRQRPKMPLMR